MKKAIAVIVIACLTALLVSACARGQGNQDAQGNQGAGPPAQRPGQGGEPSGKIVLTVGGVWIHDAMHKAAAEFNSDNEFYEIRIVSYGDDFEDGMLRLQTEVVAGGGPDIIYYFFKPMISPRIFLDLYPFIDADPEINREDFFANILLGLESPDGTLPMIANYYGLASMIGTTETVGHIDAWTPSALLSLSEETPDMEYPFGVRTGTGFIMEILRFSGTQFIDAHTFKANLDSEEFIDLLNVAKRFPEPSVLSDDDVYFAHEYIRMLRGEQLFCSAGVTGVFSFSDYNAMSKIFGDDLVVLGMPTNAGGAHFINARATMGINAATDHADAAWEFLRGFLLPGAEASEIGFPLRIDVFEAHLAEAMSPILEADGDGVLSEVPHGTYWLYDENQNGTGVELYAMAESAAKDLRAIVESAKVGTSNLPLGLFYLMSADLDAFFEGARSAEETARIMQSRVQIWLSEQELSN